MHQNKQQTYTAKLQIESLILAQRSDNDFICSISLMKGMQNYGQIKFRIDKEYTQYNFNDNRILKFSYTSRLMSRKDVFFRIILTDLQSNQQIGDIPISTHKLIEVFSENPSAIIQEKRQFFQGVALKYKIYRPVYELDISQPKIGFQFNQPNDFITALFSRPETVLGSQTSQVSKLNKSSVLKNSNQKPQSKKQQKEHSESNLQLSNTQKNQFNAVAFLGQNLLKPNKNSGHHQNNVEGEQSHMSRSFVQMHTSQFINRLFTIVRQQNNSNQRKKHTLSGNKSMGHGHGHGLSIRLKTVIFLLIFGVIMALFDFYQDKQTAQKITKKNKKNMKKKLKADHL